jgi:hypothetical protein
MRKSLLGAVAVCACLLPGTLHAQVAWDSPFLVPPEPPPGLGLFLTDMHVGGIGFMVTWRPAEWNYGLRAGIADGAGDDDIAVFGGVDYSGPISRGSASLPVDVDWVLGVGAGIGDGVRISVPLGLTAGHTFPAEGATFTPYISPRVVLDGLFGGDREGSDLGLGLAVDLGLDLRVATIGALSGAVVRFGATLGDRNAIALGVVF